MATGDLSIEKPYCAEVTWKIHDFFRQPAEVDSFLSSPSFALAKDVWQVTLYPNGSTEHNSIGTVGIYLTRCTDSIRQQNVAAKFCLKTKRGKDHISYSSKYLFDENTYGWGNKAFIARSKIKSSERFLLPNGTLTVYCQVIVAPSPEEELPGTQSPVQQIGTGDFPRKNAFSQTELLDTTKWTETVLEKTSSVQKLQSDYKELLENDEDADVCLKVSDKEFRAHKCILRARSSVFSAMFKHDTEEAATGEVVIEDMDPESFPDFLRHLYSGCTDDLTEENVFNLYIAADKYDMTDLKSECKSFMMSTLSVDTFCDVTIVALKYQEDELLKLAVDFFAKNMKKVIVTVKWQKFLIENGTVANELLIKALASEDEK